VGKGSAQGLFGITPDLSCFGKIIGGGLPVGAYGGRAEVMRYVAPVGPVYQAGTLSGNPLAMAAGIATLEALEAPGFYEELDRKTGRLMDGLQSLADRAGIPFTSGHIGSMAGFFFQEGPVHDFSDAKKSDLVRFASFYRSMLGRGIYLAPSQFEALFVSSAHSEKDVDETLNAAEAAFGDLKG
jgi:glutamate-1-semialdehyde 2,1-aminomutase